MRHAAMEHWATVKHIHQSAPDKDPPERGAFVRASCGGDETVLLEVLSLLSYQADAESFLERPAMDLARRSSNEPRQNTLAGRTLSHYQIVSLLGAGGMGEVYLARDPCLHPTVVHKILPSDHAGHPGPMRH